MIAKNDSEQFNSDVLDSDLKGRSVRGGAAVVASQTFEFAFRTVGTVVMARLLSPADFGLIAMVIVIINFTAMVKDLGLTEATIQRESITHEQLSALFVLTLLVGLVLALSIVAISPFVAWFYGEPRLVGVTASLSMVALFGAASNQHRALLRRHMSFARLAVIQVSAAGLAVSVAIGAAVLSAGYWALVLMHVARSFIFLLGVWLSARWIPSLPRSWVGVREMLRFGVHVTGHNLSSYLSRNMDNVLIGRVHGASALGFYSKAYGLLLLPIAQLRTPFIGVGLPALSRLQTEPQRYSDYYERLLRMLAFFAFPLVFVLGLYSGEIVLLLLGAQWLPSAEILRILAFAALVQVVEGTTGMVMLSSGDSRRYSRLGVSKAILTVISFAVGLPWGTRGVALSYTILNYVILLPVLAYSFRNTPVAVKTFFGAVLLPFVAAAVAASASRAVFLVLKSSIDMRQAFVLALAGVALAYFALYMVMPGGIRVLGQVKNGLRHLKKPAPRPAS